MFLDSKLTTFFVFSVVLTASLALFLIFFLSSSIAVPDLIQTLAFTLLFTVLLAYGLLFGTKWHAIRTDANAFESSMFTRYEGVWNIEANHCGLAVFACFVVIIMHP